MQVPRRDEGRNRLEGKSDAQKHQRLPQDRGTGLMSELHLITLTKERCPPLQWKRILADKCKCTTGRHKKQAGWKSGYIDLRNKSILFMLTTQMNDRITLCSALERQTFTFNSCVDLKTRQKWGCGGGWWNDVSTVVWFSKKNDALRLPRFLLRSVLVWELTGQNVKELD